jgi:hypothetical protein
MWVHIPYGPEIVRTLGLRRGHLWAGRTDEYRIVKSSLTGDTLLVVERAVDRVPLASARRDSAIARLRDQNVDVDARSLRLWEPVFSSFAVSPDGSLWVRTVSPTGTAFDVFDAGGRYLARATSPLHLLDEPGITVTNDAVYGIVRDEFDLLYVVRLAVRRPGGQ